MPAYDSSNHMNIGDIVMLRKKPLKDLERYLNLEGRGYY